MTCGLAAELHRGAFSAVQNTCAACSGALPKALWRSSCSAADRLAGRPAACSDLSMVRMLKPEHIANQLMQHLHLCRSRLRGDQTLFLESQSNPFLGRSACGRVPLQFWASRGARPGTLCGVSAAAGTPRAALAALLGLRGTLVVPLWISRGEACRSAMKGAGELGLSALAFASSLPPPAKQQVWLPASLHDAGRLCRKGSLAGM